MNKTFPTSDYEFMYLSKEYQGNKSMSQFMGEFHEPIKIMPTSQNGKNNQKENICGKAGNQANIISCMLPIPANSDTHVNRILTKRGNEHSDVKNSQQTEQYYRYFRYYI